MLIVSLGCTQRNGQISNPLKCNLQWGDGKLKDEGCEVISSKDGAPTQFQFKTKIWSPETHNIYIQFRIRKTTSLEGLKFIFSKSDLDVYSYEMPLFKDAEFNLVQDDFSTTLSFPLSALKKEHSSKTVDRVRVYIKGKTGSQTQIKINDYQIKQKAETQGVTTITFDDGYASNLIAAEMMKEQSMKGTAYLIADAIDTPEYLKKSEIKNMESMGWDISSHHQTPVTDFYPDELKKVLGKVVKALGGLSQKKSSQLHFAYPLGRHSKKSMGTIKSTFKSARLASGGVETLPVADKYRLRAINVLSTSSPESLVSYAKKAKASGDWAIFMFHFLGRPEKGDLNYSKENFQKFLDLLTKEKIIVKKVSEVL